VTDNNESPIDGLGSYTEALLIDRDPRIGIIVAQRDAAMAREAALQDHLEIWKMKTLEASERETELRDVLSALQINHSSAVRNYELAKAERDELQFSQIKMASADQWVDELSALLRSCVNAVSVLSETYERDNKHAWDDLHEVVSSIESTLSTATKYAKPVVVPQGWVVISPDGGEWSEVQSTEQFARDLAAEMDKEINTLHDGVGHKVRAIFLEAPLTEGICQGVSESPDALIHGLSDCQDSLIDRVIMRTYLVSYAHPGGSGRFYHLRATDDAPTLENIGSMEKQISMKNNIPVIAITAISLIGNSHE
jgi:hypothetical protein